MLSRLLFVRLKAAENALKDGRLDEAYRLAMAPDMREHRRGAAVLAALTERFIERARTHFRADRFTEATADLDRAESGDVLKDRIAELRANIQAVAAEFVRRQHARQDRLQAVKRRVEDGSLAAGKKMLEQASASDPAMASLRRNVKHRAQEVEAVVQHAEQLFKQGQMAQAVQRVQRAKKIDAYHQSVMKIETRLCEAVLDRARKALLEGRLSLAGDELACLGDLGERLPARRELDDMLSTARKAARCVEENEYAEARIHATSLARLLPKAGWVKAVLEQLRELEDLQTGLSAGPLGERMNHSAVAASPHARAAKPLLTRFAGAGKASLNDTVALPGRMPTDGSLPDRLLLLVDGGGSYLLLRREDVSLGRVASSSPADIPMYSDVAERHARLRHVDDDYFLFTDKDVTIGGRPTKHQLLRDGDRIVLGRKAKMTFRMPSRKSPSAVLDLSDTTKMPNDVRRVILFDRHANVGAGSTAHIRCDHAGPALVLFERNGSLWLRQKGNGHVDTEPVKLRIGETVEIAGASLVLKAWEHSTTGPRLT